MSESSHSIIDTTWIMAMIHVGAIGVIIHLYFLYKSTRFFWYINAKNRLFIGSCILLLIFNSIACLVWAMFRVNFFINVTVISCRIIYILNFLCYFIGKYILHCLLIYRIYLTFRRSRFSISRKTPLIFVIIVSINALIAILIWVISVSPYILVGKWTINDNEYEICTLFSDRVNRHLMIKLSAITIGVEDFIVGVITFFVFLHRFRIVAKEANDSYLLESAFRFGICAFISVISTFFLFTLAIPFYPNATFILATDAIINSCCLFCVTAIGEKLYKYLCYPCSVFGQRWVHLRQTNPSLSSSELIGKILSRSKFKRLNTNPSDKSFSSINITGNNRTVTATISPPPAISLPESNNLPIFSNSKSLNIYKATPSTELSLHPSKSNPIHTNVK